MGTNASTDRNFVLERYRFILEQKRSLNRGTFVIISIYQAALGIIIAGQYSVLLSDRQWLSLEFVWLASIGLISLLGVVTIFLSAMLIGGLAAWLGYRRDEVDIEGQFLGGARRMPNVRDLFKWYETYVLASMWVVTTGYACFSWQLVSLAVIAKPA